MDKVAQRCLHKNLTVILPQNDNVPSKPDYRIIGDDGTLHAMLLEETRNLPSTSYFETVQTEIQPFMRRRLVSWMLEVCMEEDCDVDVLPCAVNYLDRFLCLIPIHKHQLQTLGITCLFIASKFRQAHPLSGNQLVEYTDGAATLPQLLSWELLVLGRLRWDVSVITAHSFVDQLLYRLCLPRSLERQMRPYVASYINHVATELNLAALPPSMIACGCLCTAMRSVLKTEDAWQLLLNNLRSLTGIDCDILRSNIDSINAFIMERLTEQQPEQLPKIHGTGINNDDSYTDTTAIAVTPTDVADVRLS